MKTLPANNYQRAFQQLQAIDEAAARKLPRDIRQSNEKQINVVLVRKVNDIARERYITTFVIQAFNTRAFANLEKGYTTLGYHSMFLLHDPRLVETVKHEPQATQQPIEPKPFNVDKAKVAELREFAEDNQIELHDDDLKADIVTKIKAWQDELPQSN